MENDNSSQQTPPQPISTLEPQIQLSANNRSPIQSPDPKVTKWYKSTWFIVLLLIIIPPLGLILMWLLAPWKKYIKALVTVPVIFTSAIFLVTSASIIQSVITYGNIVREEQTKMENFLEDKYGKKFVVKDGKIVDGSDFLLRIKTKSYQAEVYPSDDAATVFTASRIIEGRSLDGGADSPDKLNYSDDYLLKLWTGELQDGVKEAMNRQPIRAFTTDFHVGLTGNKAYRAEFYDKIWGTVPTYSELSLELKQKLTLAIDIKAVGPVDANTVEAYAHAMIAARDFLDPDQHDLRVQVNDFKVYHNEKDSKPGWEWQNVGQVQLSEVHSINELTPYFVQWTDGYGKYYNPETRLFDLNNPK
jgi:hypothetical protein